MAAHMPSRPPYLNNQLAAGSSLGRGRPAVKIVDMSSVSRPWAQHRGVYRGGAACDGLGTRAAVIKRQSIFHCPSSHAHGEGLD